MEKLSHFIVNHWLLVTAFILAFIALIIVEARSKGMGGNRLSPQQATVLINQEEGVVVDIREADAFNSGHIVNAIHIPAMQLEQQLKRLEAFKKRPLIIVCATGQKSPWAMKVIKKHNFDRVYVLAGGMNAWTTAGIPVVK